MQEIVQDLAPLERQAKVEGFFDNNENAARLGSLIEGIRDATTEYQVCAATPALMDLQQLGMGGLGDLKWDIGDFDQTLFRQDPGDLNFERDFGQWFNPGGDVTLDMK